MTIEWSLSKIGEIADIKGGKRLPKGERLVNKKNSHPYIRVVDFSDGKISKENLLYVPDNVFPSIKRYIVDSGDIIISIVGTIGLIASIPPELDKSNLSENAAKILLTNSNIDHQYLSWYLKSAKGQHEISRNTVGSTQPKLPLYGIANIEFEYPPLPYQKAIAHILGTLDDKIELNRRMNETLEAMAQAIFKSWFVDFDPVIDNALKAGNPIPDRLAEKAQRRQQAQANPQSKGTPPCLLPPNIANLFPNEFVETDDGVIPKGWEVRKLSETVNLLGGGTPKTSIDEYWNGDIPWFAVCDAPNDSDVFVIDTEKHITELGLNNSSTRLLPIGTTIISARGTVGKCALVGQPMAMNQSCYGIQGKDQRGAYYTYFVIRRNISDLQRSGHGSVFNTITRSTFDTIFINDPKSALITLFDNQVAPLMNRILINRLKNKTLSALRDSLLPKLLSGELKVSETEEILEKVV